jgi:hypothetical protein
LTLTELRDKSEFELKNTETNQAAGTLVIEKIHTEPRASFVDYLRSGWGISLCVAIDFTGSNGEPHHPHSLHYLGNTNQY